MLRQYFEAAIANIPQNEHSPRLANISAPQIFMGIKAVQSGV
jgi:hypothetical protein